MRVAVIGRGVMGRRHLEAWRKLGVDAFPAGRQDVSAALVTCDVVDLCTPTATHPELALTAAAAGLHVICEKPLALTSAQAERMAADCAAAGVRLLPAHVVRWFPDYAEAKRAVVSGALGALRELSFTRRAPAPTWSPWFADPKQSGGVLTDLLIHDLDAARWIAGEVVEVSAVVEGGDLAGASARVRMRHANGAVSRVEGCWTSEDMPLTSPFTVAGDTGEWSGSGATGGHDPYADQLRELLAAITTGAPARVSAADGVAAVALAERARAAARAPEQG